MSKNIVICCDGTKNSAKDKNITNICKIGRAAINDGIQQVSYYDPGVATECRLTTIYIRQYVWGFGLSENIRQAYFWLKENYNEGDKLYLLGFSRGAYTVRALSGMLFKCGLLNKNDDSFKEVEKVYEGRDNGEDALCLKRQNRTVPVHFMGIFDSVAALGIIHGEKYFDASLNTEVLNAYHALAVDEIRELFHPEKWSFKELSGANNAQQVWFTGGHSDIGGGWPESGLSDITLEWMLNKSKQHGLLIDANFTPKPDSSDSMHIKKSFGGLFLNGLRQIASGSFIHKSVIERMENNSCKYSPRNLPEKYQVVQ